jgi:hypothetical protein
MIVYDLEFAHIKGCLQYLNGYSHARIKLLELLLSRYEDAIQDLYVMDNVFFNHRLKQRSI